MVAAWCSRCFHGRGSAAAMSAHRAALVAMKTSNACGDANAQDGTVAAQASATAGVWPSAMSQSAVQAGSIHGAPRVGHAQSTTRAACWVIYPSSRQQSERLRRCAGLVTLGLPRGGNFSERASPRIPAIYDLSVTFACIQGGGDVATVAWCYSCAPGTEPKRKVVRSSTYTKRPPSADRLGW